MVQPSVHIRPALTFALAFLFSACGLSYQQLLVYALFDVSGNFVLSQSLGLGAFLFGMGLGSWRPGRASFTKLFVVEMSLATLGFLSVFLIYAGEVALRYFYPALPQDRLFLVFLPLVTLAGFLNGREIPLLMGLSPVVPPARILGVTYLGGLLALVAVPVILLPALDLSRAVFAVAIVNFILSCVVAWFFIPSRWAQVTALVLAAALVPWLKFEPTWRDLHLKFIYFPVRYSNWDDADKDWLAFENMDAPVRLRSRYQWIDLLPSASSRFGDEENSLSLYLDRKFQLNALTERRYHEGLVEAGIHLLGHAPKKVLILGGGDGLLAAYLLKHPEITEIDLVELDPAVLKISADNGELKRLNRGALRDPRVHVVAGDAFHFVRTSEQKYDLIFTDFPLPTTYELSLLYTREFYAFTRSRLSPDGLLLMDFALPDKTLEGLAVLASTLKSAGFGNPLAFGHEDLFLAMAANGRALKFNYREIQSNRILMSVNSQRAPFEQAAARNAPVNSLFFPYRFDFIYPDNMPARRFDSALRPVFYERYAAFHAQEFFEAGAWPTALKEALTKEIANPASSADIKWEHRFEGPRNSSILHWYDCDHAGELKQIWRTVLNKAFPPGDWCGITYDARAQTFVTHTKTGDGFDSSDGTRIVRTSQGLETRRDNEVLFTRYFSERQLNLTPGSREHVLMSKIFEEFMILPSSFTMSSKLKVRGLFYP